MWGWLSGRPILVTLIVVLTAAAGVVEVLGGLIILLGRGGTAAHSIGRIPAWVIDGILAIVVGLFNFALARWLARGNLGARLFVGVLSALAVAYAIYAHFAPSGERTVVAIAGVVAAVTLSSLYSPTVKEFFTDGGR